MTEKAHTPRTLFDLHPEVLILSGDVEKILIKYKCVSERYILYPVATPVFKKSNL